MEKKTKTKKSGEKMEKENCDDVKCPVHGKLNARGRIFEGRVTKKHHKRIAMELERTVYVRKYERYAKSKTKLHAHLPDCMANNINAGDLIKIQECRPLSKIIHFVVVKKLKGAEEK